MTNEERIAALQANIDETLAAIDTEARDNTAAGLTVIPLPRAVAFGQALGVTFNERAKCQRTMPPEMIAAHYPKWDEHDAKIREALAELQRMVKQARTAPPPSGNN